MFILSLQTERTCKAICPWFKLIAILHMVFKGNQFRMLMDLMQSGFALGEAASHPFYLLFACHNHSVYVVYACCCASLL